MILYYFLPCVKTYPALNMHMLVLDYGAIRDNMGYCLQLLSTANRNCLHVIRRNVYILITSNKFVQAVRRADVTKVCTYIYCLCYRYKNNALKQI
jgi:hypothetical protein